MCENRISPTKQQQPLPTAHHSCGAFAASTNVTPARSSWRWPGTPQYTLASLPAAQNPSVSSCDEASSHFDAESEISNHITDYTVPFAVQPTNPRHRRSPPDVARPPDVFRGRWITVSWYCQGTAALCHLSISILGRQIHIDCFTRGRIGFKRLSSIQKPIVSRRVLGCS